ncbi:SigB/SigF/SigG family RNA polymerase sigma factor [Streptomyces iconiensis]|uniref:SigB/SigF/SigG family RNA polymerase sigma factor n=1 Tax=Streptomyces iconiensis TaxID=1384038 RepID=A0ABT7AAA8_9ACTN|nr:SigB/SigF/SigG family RNA polymerase sigma factor [Streptomyces iconiensis]MDJ1137982.1 SigB/SigF/SigG family RNA polymerase sigma factor [Streptomyces iconiensis]
MTTTAQPPRSGRGHQDAPPDTAHDFAELTRLPDGPAKRELRDCVVAAWLPMAHRLARRFRNRGETLEDLEQVAALALVKAVERYDPARGHAFETFAIPTITGELKRHFRDNMWQVHVPRRVQNIRNEVRRSIRELELTSAGRPPTTQEVAGHCGLSEDEVRMGLEALHSFTSLSLDAPVTTGGVHERELRLEDALGAGEPGYDHAVDREAAKTYLCHLPERERYILYLRFFQEMPQRRIAERVGLSQMHVSRLISTACRHIREAVDADHRVSRWG